MRSGANFTTKEGTMKLNIYSIFDQASGLYCRPFFTQSDGEAARSFNDIACDAEHPIGKHPEDYTLYRLGIFDDNNGLLHNEENQSLMTALETISSSRRTKQDNFEGVHVKEHQLPGNGEDPSLHGDER